MPLFWENSIPAAATITTRSDTSTVLQTSTTIAVPVDEEDRIRIPSQLGDPLKPWKSNHKDNTSSRNRDSNSNRNSNSNSNDANSSVDAPFWKLPLFQYTTAPSPATAISATTTTSLPILIATEAPTSTSTSTSRSVSTATPTEASLTDSSEGTEITMATPRQVDKYGFILNMDDQGLLVDDHMTNNNRNGTSHMKSNTNTNIISTTHQIHEIDRRREKKWKATLTQWGGSTYRSSSQSKKGRHGLSQPQLQQKQKQSQKERRRRQTQSSSVMSTPILQKLPRRRQKKLIQRLRKGVPDSIRGDVWMALGGGLRIRQSGLYQQILQTTSDAMMEDIRNRVKEARNNNQNGKDDDDYDDSTTNRFGENQHSSPGQNDVQEAIHVVEEITATIVPLKEDGDTDATISTNRTSPQRIQQQQQQLSTGSSSSSSGSGSRIGSKAKSNGQNSQPFFRDGSESLDADSDLPVDYAYTKEFRVVQDTIERDIHRTFPKHNLFYDDDKQDAPDEDALITHAASVLGLTTMKSDPELALLALNLQRDIETISATGAVSTQLRVVTTPTATTAVSSPSLGGIDFNRRFTSPDGQAALRRVLRAYSYYDRETSYCQGMNFIAGMFLTVMSEEDAFWLLVAVMHHKPCEMRGMFGEGMKETHKVLHVAESLIHLHLPKLARHFDKENIHVTMFATQWLLTQYTSSFKFDLVTRVWDAFLGEGWKIIYRVMLALLLQCQSQLLKMSFEEILAFFRDISDKVDGNTIMETAMKIKLKTRQIEKIEKEWQATLTTTNTTTTPTTTTTR